MGRPKKKPLLTFCFAGEDTGAWQALDLGECYVITANGRPIYIRPVDEEGRHDHNRSIPPTTFIGKSSAQRVADRLNASKCEIDEEYQQVEFAIMAVQL